MSRTLQNIFDFGSPEATASCCLLCLYVRLVSIDVEGKFLNLWKRTTSMLENTWSYLKNFR